MSLGEHPRRFQFSKGDFLKVINKLPHLLGDIGDQAEVIRGCDQYGDDAYIQIRWLTGKGAGKLQSVYARQFECLGTKLSVAAMEDQRDYLAAITNLTGGNNGR